MKKIDVTKFPKFIHHAKATIMTDLELVAKAIDDGAWPYHIVMHMDGFMSANIGERDQRFLLNDKEYAWFVLKWT